MNAVSQINKEHIELIGDNHISSNVDTPLLKNAFEKSDEEKISKIQTHFSNIMEELGLDLSDELAYQELLIVLPKCMSKSFSMD